MFVITTLQTEMSDGVEVSAIFVVLLFKSLFRGCLEMTSGEICDFLLSINYVPS